MAVLQTGGVGFQKKKTLCSLSPLWGSPGRRPGEFLWRGFRISNLTVWATVKRFKPKTLNCFCEVDINFYCQLWVSGKKMTMRYPSPLWGSPGQWSGEFLWSGFKIPNLTVWATVKWLEPKTLTCFCEVEQAGGLDTIWSCENHQATALDGPSGNEQFWNSHSNHDFWGLGIVVSKHPCKTLFNKRLGNSTANGYPLGGVHQARDLESPCEVRNASKCYCEVVQAGDLDNFCEVDI